MKIKGFDSFIYNRIVRPFQRTSQKILVALPFVQKLGSASLSLIKKIVKNPITKIGSKITKTALKIFKKK